MRAIHINPWSRTITEVDIEADGDDCLEYEGLRAVVFPPPARPGYLEHVDLGGKVGAYVDEEGLLVNWDQQRFVRLHPPGQPEAGHTLAGHVVLVTDDGWGNSVALDPAITVFMVACTVRWLDAAEVSVPAPKVYTQRADGSFEVADDQGTWSYDRQP